MLTIERRCYKITIINPQIVETFMFTRIANFFRSFCCRRHQVNIQEIPYNNLALQQFDLALPQLDLVLPQLDLQALQINPALLQMHHFNAQPLPLPIIEPFNPVILLMHQVNIQLLPLPIFPQHNPEAFQLNPALLQMILNQGIGQDDEKSFINLKERNENTAYQREVCTGMRNRSF